MNNAFEAGVGQTAVLTVCTGERFAEALREAFDSRSWNAQFYPYEAYLSAERRPALGTLRAAASCIAFVDFDRDPEQAAAAVHYLSSVLSARFTVVAVAETMDPAVMLNAMRAGCGEFIEGDASERELLDLLERLEKTESNGMRTNIASGSLISFFGAKGGAGTTTLAVHLATYLVRIHKKRVLLVDYHAELGHVSVYLSLDGARCHFQEVVRNVGRLDSELLRGFVGKHNSGLEILSSPDMCGGAKHIEHDAVARTLDFLRGEYDYVLLDCDRPTAEMNQAVIEASTLIYLVATPDVGAIRDLSRFVDILVPPDGANEKLQVVINRASSPYAIHVTQIEKAMKLPIAIRISSAYPELVKAGNLGEPLPAGSNTELTAQFTKWANNLVGATAATPATKKSKGLFGMFR